MSGTVGSCVCRSCGAVEGRLILDLGLQPLANNLLRPEDLGKEEPRVPLRVFVCPQCWLLQITDLVPPVELFSQYLYLSSFSDAMVAHAREAVTRYVKEYGLGPGHLVVEVASNDGYLLQHVKSAGVRCLGVEPAANIAEMARGKGIPTVVEFFGEDVARKVALEHGSADLILGNNVFAHAPDTNDFVGGLWALLKREGRVILEFPSGMELIQKREFDTIYHEHVFYFTVTALKPLFERHGLEIVDVERIAIHGGSIRLFVGHRGVHRISSRVAEWLRGEEVGGVRDMAFYEGFGAAVRELKDELCSTLRRLKREGCSIAAYGASAKGSTLLNYCGLPKGTLDFVADRSTVKQGRLTPGTHLPIVPAEELARRRPDYALLLTWNFAEEILRQQQGYRDGGGQFIVPIPQVRVV